jgi:hypothetical protein
VLPTQGPFEMAVVHVLDDYYLAITLLVTVAYQLFFFSIAFTLKFDKLTGMGNPCRTPLHYPLPSPHYEIALIHPHDTTLLNVT